MTNLQLQALHHAATEARRAGKTVLLIGPAELLDLLNAYWAAEKRASVAEDQLATVRQGHSLFSWDERPPTPLEDIRQARERLLAGTDNVDRIFPDPEHFASQ